MIHKYSQLSPVREDIYLYKYLTVDRFGQILADKVLRFNRADQLIEYHKGILSPAERKHLHLTFLKDENDKEGRKGFNRTVSAYKRLCRQTYLCCWSQNLDEQLMNKYMPDGNGVAIRVSAYDLMNELNTAQEYRKPEFFQVEYIDYEEDVDSLPDGVNIFARKKSELHFESEVRAAILIESKKTNPEMLSVKVNPLKLIDEIIVAPNANFEFQLRLMEMIDEYDLHDKAQNVTFFSSKSKDSAAEKAIIQRNTQRMNYR